MIISNTPWKYRFDVRKEFSEIFSSDNEIVCRVFGKTYKVEEGNVKYIVSCINSHQELLEACKAILTLDELDMGDDSLLPDNHPKQMVINAISKATRN